MIILKSLFLFDEIFFCDVCKSHDADPYICRVLMYYTLTVIPHLKLTLHFPAGKTQAVWIYVMTNVRQLVSSKGD